MIDKFIVRPFLALFTFVKRNPLLATLLIVILFLLPPLLVALFRVVSWTLNGIKMVLGVKAAEAAAKVASAVMTWMQNNHWACPAFALAIGVFSPLVGGVLTAWCLVDRFKTGAEVTVLPEPTPLPDTPQPEINPDLTGIQTVDDYFNKGVIFV